VSAIFLSSLRHIAAGYDGQEAWMQPLTALTPEGVDVKRLDHLPLVGAMLRELAGQETLEALIPPTSAMTSPWGSASRAWG
jgi:hypothetical protein